MQFHRLSHLLSADRRRRCQALFRHPSAAQRALAFLTRGPRTVTLHNGRSLSFSRRGHDDRLWDWLFNQPEVQLDFTLDGEIWLRRQGHTVLIRPGTDDFLVYREIFLEDQYGLATMAGRLGTVIDVGGNVGLFSAAVVRRARRVLCVEPVAANHAQARKNVRLNGGQADDVLRYAVTDRSGREAVLYLADHRTGNHSLAPAWSGTPRAAQDSSGGAIRHETVPTISLEDLIERAGPGPIDLLKCDVEGAEYEIFLSTPPAVLARVRHLVMEIHVDRDHPPAQVTRLEEHLIEAGFAVTRDGKLDPPGSRRQAALLTATSFALAPGTSPLVAAA